MKRTLTLFAAGLLLWAGCVSVDPMLSNLLSAGAKLASNPADPPIGDLSAGEFIAISANIPMLASQFPELVIPVGVSFPTLTPQQAADLVAFLRQYNITTVSQLQQLLVDVSEGRVEVTVPQSLIDFVDSLGYETDAAKLAPEM